ncbi:hypothetical protein ACIHBQ_03825 [Streptomyces sp. NPDC052492]|uniref:hypothetical protein n=1 Tax=unclassified Streptomyces TaxID=2593676 RepID=UPI0037D334E5
MAANHTTRRPGGRAAGCLQAVMVPLILIGIIAAWNHFDDDRTSSSPSSDPSSSSSDPSSDDAGAGGGRLMEGDCVDADAREIACARAGSADYKVLGLVTPEADCPSGTTYRLKPISANGRPHDVICATAAA